MSILIIDDSQSLRLLLKNFLSKAGYEDILTAESPIDAFEILGMDGSEENVPDIELIIMDIVMPEMDGIEGCRRIKAEESLKNIPIVMLTGENDQTRLDAAIEAGAEDYVSKPLNRELFLEKIEPFLKK